jgi:hypothetical protein
VGDFGTWSRHVLVPGNNRACVRDSNAFRRWPPTRHKKGRPAVFQQICHGFANNNGSLAGCRLFDLVTDCQVLAQLEATVHDQRM